MSYKEGIIAAISATTSDDGCSIADIKNYIEINLPHRRKWEHGIFKIALRNALTDGVIQQVKKDRYSLPIKKKGKVKHSASKSKKMRTTPSATKSTTKNEPTTPLPPPEEEDASTKAAIDAAIAATSRVLNDALAEEWTAGAEGTIVKYDEVEELDIAADEADDARCQEQMEEDLRRALQRADNDENKKQAQRAATQSPTSNTTTKNCNQLETIDTNNQKETVTPKRTSHNTTKVQNMTSEGTSTSHKSMRYSKTNVKLMVTLSQNTKMDSNNKGCWMSKGEEESSRDDNTNKWQIKTNTLQQKKNNCNND